MSLYNVMHGFSDLAAYLLNALNIDVSKIPRFRDCYIRDSEIVVLTRTGGGNRESYEEENEAMTKHPNYLRDRDDDFDCTFAEWFYSFPKEQDVELKKLAQSNQEPTLKEKTDAVFAAIEAHTTKQTEGER